MAGSLIYSAVLTDNPSKDDARNAIYMTIGVVVLAIALIFTVKEHHHRHDHEKRVGSPAMPVGEGTETNQPAREEAAWLLRADENNDTYKATGCN